MTGSGVEEAEERENGQWNKAHCPPPLVAVSLTVHFSSEGLTQQRGCALMQLAAESKLKEAIIRCISSINIVS